MQASYADGQDQEELSRDYDDLYARFGRAFEATNAGQYLAISRDGGTLTGATLAEVAKRAREELREGVFLYKIGERAVGKWLTVRG